MKSYEYYNKIADLYDSMYDNKEWDIVRKAVKSYIENTISPHNLDVVDIGSGTGYWAEYFLKLGNNVTIVEPSKNMLEKAKEKLGDNVYYINSTVEELNVEEKYDVANLQGDVLSYVENLEKAMKKLSDILKPGGYLFATVDSFYYMSKLVFKYGTSKEKESFLKTHITTVGSQYGLFLSRCFTCEDIKALEKYGFVLHEIRGVGYCSDLASEISLSQNTIYKAEHIYFSLRKR
ncbi:class I SAM-dependent methyltransferase [Thermosipho ferrireducens]|uniref:Class I SAM-dependent methyltransferase n=1 Tax=Thermosipho ferrireducens TaxID=2571116 RepID=A0ABX7S4U7_9BACT|nr:class I SAM-dependent methyltransferase [Thermosipho ferrireducens]QTA37511.1 class I SAM-dependent methyltransferase [Thermosipho ferrireducens]